MSDRYSSGWDVHELDDGKADYGLARHRICRGGATENLPTVHEPAASGILVRITGDEDSNSRV